MWRELLLQSATKLHLANLLTRDETRIDYTYDFGDSWHLSNGDPEACYPRLVAGGGNCPPGYWYPSGEGRGLIPTGV